MQRIKVGETRMEMASVNKGKRICGASMRRGEGWSWSRDAGEGGDVPNKWPTRRW